MAKVIMVQGTMSNVGKSLLTAGLCRVFKQDGYKVAPFKSQNMALNSFITKDGMEMGRAQVMQAEACGIEPDVAMNPILLKPTNDTGSQVIVNGEVLKVMPARDYFAYKKQLIPDIKKAFQKLESEYDIIVIEGAGSPAEINLKKDDIVNMGLARMLHAPVLLVGDIDRGGVFAQLYGTIELLDPEERDLVKALIINKFRGDKTILEPGIETLEKLCKRKVAGVVPYVTLDIDDEDSLSERFSQEKSNAQIHVCAIRLPRISNFTDLNALECYEDVSVSYVTKPQDLEQADLILLPGTKSTMEDLKWLRESGLEAAILKQASHGTLIMGICGGYQMLGTWLHDPEGVESSGTIKGMGLLPMETTFTGKKVRTRVQGTVKELSGVYECLSGKRLEGYEIHMGTSVPVSEEGTIFSKITEQTNLEPVSKTDGMVKENVLGTYVHGIFDCADFSESMIKLLYEKKGLSYEPESRMSRKEYKELQYDKLADAVRNNMDMDLIYQILG